MFIFLSLIAFDALAAIGTDVFTQNRFTPKVVFGLVVVGPSGPDSR